MPGYLIQHAGRHADALIEDPTDELYPHFHDGWLIITNQPATDLGIAGTVHYAAPRDHITSLQRTDSTPEDDQPEE